MRKGVRRFSVVALAFLLAVPSLAKGKTETLAAPFDDVWKATLAVVAEEFTLGSVSHDDGVISFRSGTQDASVLIARASDDSTTLTVNAKAARAGLSIGLGVDAKKVQNKLLKGVRAKLGLKE
jgi:hypothetical protein